MLLLFCKYTLKISKSKENGGKDYKQLNGVCY